MIDGGLPLAGSPADQRGLDRLFEIHRGAGDVTIGTLTLREGYAEDGGGALQNWSPGHVRLEAVHILGSNTAGSGGGVNNADPSVYPCELCPSMPPLTIPGGHVEIVDSRLSGNASTGGGAAVNNASTGTISILASDVTLNPGPMVPDPAQVIDPFDPEPVRLIPGPGAYEPHTGAIANEAEGGAAGTVRIADSEISENFTPGDGAGVHNAGDGEVVIERTDLVDNVAEGNGGAVHTAGGRLTISGSTVADNLAHAEGGGIHSAGGVSALGLRPRVRISATGITDNTAWAAGGGLLAGGDTELLVTDAEFESNHARTTRAAACWPTGARGSPCATPRSPATSPTAKAAAHRRPVSARCASRRRRSSPTRPASPARPASRRAAAAC